MGLGLEMVPNDAAPPPPTDAELTLRELLQESDIPFRVNQVLWFCSQRPLTPDFIVGKHLVLEVEGPVHDESWIQAHDRIRERALVDLGYEVRFLTNDQVFRADDRLLEQINWWHRTAESGGRTPRIRPIDPPKLRPINLEKIDLDLITENVGHQLEGNMSWETLENSVSRVDPMLTQFPGFIEVLSLRLFGGFLCGDETGRQINFDLGKQAFAAGLSLLTRRFGENATRGAKNQLIVTTPNFFKNLIFLGGPKINQGLVHVASLEDFRANIAAFNKAFGDMGIAAIENEVISECHEQLKQRPELLSKSNLAWLRTLT